MALLLFSTLFSFSFLVAIPSNNSLYILEIDAAAKTNRQEKNQKETECSFLEQLCLTSGQLSVQMAAVPHTASSSTDSVFEAGKKAWNASARIHELGFSCRDAETVQFSPHCQKPRVPECVLSKLRFNSKLHENYNQLISDHSGIIFTILREPEQLIRSHYNMREHWDAKWEQEYPDGPNVTDVEPSEWAAKDWWRHNLFTKMLATDTKLIWAGKRKFYKGGQPIKEESYRENSLGEDSAWLKVALQRLQGMPFFGLMHRLTESFELMGFHLCFPVTAEQDSNKRQRKVDPILKKVVQKHFVLDTILLREAEKLFDKLVQDMGRKKEQGMLCDLGKVLKAPELEMGFKCSK